MKFNTLEDVFDYVVGYSESRYDVFEDAKRTFEEEAEPEMGIGSLCSLFIGPYNKRIKRKPGPIFGIMCYHSEVPENGFLPYKKWKENKTQEVYTCNTFGSSEGNLVVSVVQFIDQQGDKHAAINFRYLKNLVSADAYKAKKVKFEVNKDHWYILCDKDMAKICKKDDLYLLM